MPLLWPLRVRTNSHELVDHTWEEKKIFRGKYWGKRLKRKYLDGPVTAGRNDVLLVKINYVHSRPEKKLFYLK